jgi:hypothetical protein
MIRGRTYYVLKLRLLRKMFSIANVPTPNNGKAQKKNGKRKNKNKRKQQGNKQPNPVSQPSVPVAYGQQARIPKPRFKQSKPGCTRVTHTELIGDITGSDLFTATPYQINAGLQSMFTWLANIASNYETYKFHRLRFRYTNACASTQVGYVYLSVEFDPADPTPTSEQQLAAYQDTVYGSAWMNHTYTCSPKSMSRMNSYLVRNGAGPSPNELPQFDVGFLVVATNQNSGTPFLGKLWVDYDVEFSTPQMNSPAVGNSLSGRFSGTNDFTSNPTKVGNMPLTATVAAGVLTITSSQAYQSLVNLTISGVGLAAVAVTPVGGTAVTSLVNQITNPGGTNAFYLGQINFPFQGATFTAQIDTTTSVTAYAFRFGQYNNSFA